MPPLQPAVRYQYRAGQHDLVMIFDGPSAVEIEDIRKGECEFGLHEDSGVIFLLYRFGRSVSWSDCPYQWHLERPENQDTPRDEPSEQTRALLQITLIDAASGVVKVLRAVTWSPEFTRAVHAAIRRQAAAPWSGAANYNSRLRRIWDTTGDAQMVKAASCRCRGGD